METLVYKRKMNVQSREKMVNRTIERDFHIINIKWNKKNYI